MTDKADKRIQRKRRQETLRTSEVRYRRLFETAKDGILLLDADTGRITDVNPFLQDMLGYSHSELIGKALWEIGPVKDIAASQNAMRQLQDKEYVRYENLPLETKAGQQVHVEFVSNVYLVNGSRVIQCNVRDITARKKVEDDMRLAHEGLLASMAELQKREEEMTALIRLNGLLQSCRTEAEAYRVMTLKARELFDGRSGCLAVCPTQGRRLEVVAVWGGDEMAIESSFSLADCWAMRRSQLHEVIDPQADMLCYHFVRQPQQGYMCVPLIVQGELTALLCLVGRNKHQISQRQLAVTMGETIKLSLSNLKLREKLREEAIHDPLTGLFNRRYLEETLARELHRATRGDSPLCVAMLDLDKFKPFNDTFGHDAGDALLRQLGPTLRQTLRKSDIACRYGGDEFVLVLPDSSLADTHQRVEQICVLVKELQIHDGQQLLDPITVSAGVARAPEHNSTAPELIHAADEAMYVAKKAGGNHVVDSETESLIAGKQLEGSA